MKNKNEYGLIALVALVAGCMSLPSVGPDYKEVSFELPETSMPDAGMPIDDLTKIGEYKSAKETNDLRVEITTNEIVSWWSKFNDPLLDKLINRAVSDNRSYLAAQERLIQARWQLFGAYAAFMPKLDASGNATWTEKGANTPSGAGDKRFGESFTVGFDASWEIDIFGGSRRAAEAAWADSMAAGWGLSEAWVTLTAEVARRYIELRTTQQRIEVARTNLVLQSETYDILKSRLDSGIGDELAVNQSKYVVDQTRARIPQLLAQEEKLKNAIAVLAGEMPGSLHAELSSCPVRDWMVRPMRLSQIPLDMLRSRPDVRKSERQFAAEVARIGVAKSLWYPKFFINGSFGLENLKANHLFERESFFAAIGPSVSWPIFRGGSIYANIKAQEALMHEKCLSYELTLQNAYAEVRDVYAAYTQEYHRHKALKGAVKAAQDAVSISKDLYKNGLRDFTAVIDAQRSLLNLQEELVVSRGEITLNAISLFKSLGGGIAQ